MYLCSKYHVTQGQKLKKRKIMRRLERFLAAVALLVTSAFNAISAETKVITKEFVNESFDQASVALGKYATFTTSPAGWQPGTTANISGVMFMAVPIPMSQYGYLDFGYGYSNIEDNWVMEFDLEMPNISTAKGQVAVTGENSSVASGEYINNAYLSFVAMYSQLDRDAVSNIDELRRHKIIVGGEELEGTILIRSVIHVKMECTKANTSSAELKITLNCADFSNYVIEKTVDAQALGKPRGFYCYSPEMQSGEPKQFVFDNIKLTAQSSEEYEKCAVPTFTVTGASGTSRTVAIACATEGAEIYYSSTPLNIGGEGWIKYDGEITSEYKTLYAYAVNAVFEDTTEVVSFNTGAGSQPRFRPQIIKLGYEPGKGYRFTIDPNLESIGVMPQEYTWLYSVNGESGEQMNYNQGDTLYVAEGNTVWTQMEAKGYTRGRATWATEPYPNLNTVWEEDLIGKIDIASMGTSQMPLTLSSESSFVMEEFYKSFYSIAKVGNTDISIDSRITLTTDSVFFMQKEDDQKGGLLSLKHDVPELDYDSMTEEELANSDELYYSRYEGMGIKGLSGGEYVFIRTNGNEPELMSGNAELVSGASTRNEYIYKMYSEGGNLYVTLPYGTYVTSVAVRSDKELITTNEYGYAAYMTDNALDFSDMPSEFKAEIVTAEETSGNFTYTEVLDAPAGDAVIITGTPNKTYLVPVLSSAEGQGNMLAYNETAVDISNVEKPVYVLDLTNGKMQKVADKSQPIPARTPYIISALDETVYRHYTMSSSGRLSIYSDKALDFSGVEGLKAYALEYETPDSVHLKPVTQLPANNGAILEGTAGTTYDVPEVPTASIPCDNFFMGSETEDFITTSTDKVVYALNSTTGKVEIIDKSSVSIIPAGESYYITKYEGFETVKTNASGALTLITSNALDFREVGIRAYIATGEVGNDSVILSPVSAVPAGTPILLKNGKPNTEYRIPYKEGEVTIGDNKFRGSMTEDFDVSTENHYVYGLLENSDRLTHVDQTAVIPAGTVYLISQYELPVIIKSVDIAIPSTGMRSFVTDKALDFTGMDSLEVLVCDTVTLDGPQFKRVYEVPAHTAFFVKGKAGVTYKVPVGTCDSLDVVNLIEGSNEKGFYVGSVNTYVYTVINGKVDVAPSTMSLSWGVGYIISPWKGYETITTSASGATTYVTKGALDFSSLKGELMALIVYKETVSQIFTIAVDQVPAKTPIILQGAPKTTYKVPTGNCLEPSRKNLLQGSWDKEFAVADTANIVYVVSGGVFKVAAKTMVMAKGKAYFVSKYRGYEKVTTSESGHTSYVCEHALDLTDVYNEVEAYIAIRERPTEFDLERIVKIPAGTPFFVKSLEGEVSKTYSLPYANEEVTELPSGTITRGSRTEEHLVSEFGDSTVFVLSDGKFKTAAKTMVLEAGKAYIVSKYLGYDYITTSASGFTTYVSDKPLDIRDYDGEVRMFIVESEDEDSIYTKEVFEVPSNTPFIFQGAEAKDSTYKIPWGNCQSLPYVNLLRGSLTEEFYCNSVGDSIVYVVSGGKFMRASRDKVMEPREAYLVSNFLDSDAGAKSAFFIDEEATGIGGVQDEQKKRSSRRVNLAGQEVDDTYKGIVIDENGRKHLQR